MSFVRSIEVFVVRDAADIERPAGPDGRVTDYNRTGADRLTRRIVVNKKPAGFVAS